MSEYSVEKEPGKRLFGWSEHMIQLIQRQPAVFFLTAITILYNILEAVVSTSVGAENRSMSLTALGGDSAIEVLSAALVIWRFLQEDCDQRNSGFVTERRAALAIGWLCVLIALSTAVSSSIELVLHEHPSHEISAVIISAVGLVFGAYIWKKKAELGKKIGSEVLQQDAVCSLACCQLSAFGVIGTSLTLAVRGWWWADAVAALCASVLIAKEGIESIIHSWKLSPDYRQRTTV